jgi:hypothetical protein
MSIPDQFPRRFSRAGAATAAPPDAAIGDGAAGTGDVVAAPRSWPWRRAALLASIAAQLITIAALEGADPVPATWTAVLLAVAPVPLALVAAFAPAPAGRSAGGSGAGDRLIGQVTHTAVFFLPALAAMTGAAVRLWREGA